MVDREAFDPGDLDEFGAPPSIRRLTFVSVVVVAALVAIDITVVNVALPSILGDLGGGVETVQWVASVYTLAYAVLMIPAGRAGDVIGHRRLFLLGTSLYVVSSLIAALAPTALVLIVARALQGAGAAMVSPAVIALTARVFAPDRRHVMFGISAGVLSAAAGLGPLVGGALTDALGWRWIFVFGVVIAPLSLIGMGMVPRTIDPPAVGRFDPDLGGIALLIVGVGGIQLALIESARLGWWPLSTVALAIGVVTGGVLIRRDRTRPDGLIDARLFESPVMSGALIAKFLSSFAYYGSLLYVVLFLEGTMGLSPFEVGLVMLVPAVVGVAASPIVGRLLKPSTVRPIIVVGMLLEAGSMMILAALESTSHAGLHVVPGLFLNALGFSLISVTSKVAPLDDLPSTLYGRASALVGTVGKLSAGFGVAAGAALFHVYSQTQAEEAVVARQLDPPVAPNDVRRCLGVDDLQRCVDQLVDRVPAVSQRRGDTVDAIVATFEGTLGLTLVTIGVIGLVATGVVWRLLRPREDPALEQGPPAP